MIGMIALIKTELTAAERIATRTRLAATLVSAGGDIESEAERLASLLVPESDRPSDVVWRVVDENRSLGWIWTRGTIQGHAAVVALSVPREVVGDVVDALRRRGAMSGVTSLDYVVSRGDELAAELHASLMGDLTSVQMTVKVGRVPPPTSIGLRPMDTARFGRFLEASIEGHAADLYASGPLPNLDAARAESRRQTEQLLERGVSTPGHLLWSAFHHEDEVGVLWVQRREHRDFIYRIEVDPLHRRRGYGREILRAGAEEARQTGLEWLSLNVFGSNLGAQALYQQEGYEPTQENFTA